MLGCACFFLYLNNSHARLIITDIHRRIVKSDIFLKVMCYCLHNFNLKELKILITLIREVKKLP